MYDLASRSGANWSGLFISEVLLIAGMLIVPCALLGAIFPVATRLLQREDGGHAAGSAYAVNTAGTIAGSLAAGFVMVPTWGVQGTQTGCPRARRPRVPRTSVPGCTSAHGHPAPRTGPLG